MSFTRALPRGDDAYDWELQECGYYLDLQSRAVLDTWVNPLNGKSVKPAHFDGQIMTLAELGGLLAMTEDLYVNLPAMAAVAGHSGMAS